MIYEKHINKLYLYNFYILFKIIKEKYYIFFTYPATTLGNKKWQIITTSGQSLKTCHLFLSSGASLFLRWIITEG